jgi:uracil-DNA glycosylase family 4
MSRCTDCSLYEDCQSVKIESKIKHHQSDILIVLDAPDRDDDRNNAILSRDVGKKLLYLMEAAGLDKDRVSYTYAIRCKPTSNSQVKRKHIEACRKYIFQEIIELKPKVIIPMGKIAHWMLTGHQSVSEFRGHFTNFDLDYSDASGKQKKISIPMLPSQSPHASMSKWELHDYIIHDLKKALEFADTGKIHRTPVPNHDLILTRQGLKDFMDYMLSGQVKWSTNDLETTGFSFFNDKIINAGYCTNENKVFVLHTKEYQKEHFKKWDKENQELGVKINEFVRNNRENIFKVMKRVHDSDIKWIYHNGKFDLKFLKKNGVPIKNFAFDTLLADSYIDENKMHSLNFCLEYRGHNFGAYDTELYPYVGKKEGKTYEFIPPKLIGKYLCIDVYGDALLFRDQVKELKSEGLYEYFMKTKMQALREMTEAEYVGVKVDVPLIKETEKQLSLKIKEYEAKAKEITGNPDFNLSSPKQVVEYMTEAGYPFNKLKIRQTKTGYSTDKKALTAFVKYKRWSEFPQLILNHKTLTKLAGTYVAGKIGRKEGTEGGMLQYIDENHFVHANFNLWTPRTGRYSCNKPSLQVWPRPLKDLPNIRNFIIPIDEDHVLWEADYSQLEQCVVAVLSKDTVLLGKIQDGTDLHCFNAVELGKKLRTMAEEMTYEYMMCAVGKENDIPENLRIDPKSIEDQIKVELKIKRTFAKNIGFGLNYGKGAMTFAEEFGISIEEAEEMVEAYFALYKKMKAWRDNTVADALTKGFITLLSGRKRRFHQAVNWLNSEYADGLWGTRKLSEEISRQAMNSPVQGGAHDVFEPAKIRLLERFRKEGIKAPLHLSIHDGLVGSCHKDDIQKVKQCLLEELPTTFYAGTKLELRLKVDVEFYKRNWYAEKLHV